MGDMGDLAPGTPREVGLKRHLLLPGLLLTAAEILLVALPLWSLFDLGAVPSSVLARIIIPVFVGMSVLWLAGLATWFAPIHRATQRSRRGQRLPEHLAEPAYRATLRVPMRLLAVRVALWGLAVLVIGAFLVRYAGWLPRQVMALVSLAVLHALPVSIVRAVWYAAVLSAVRMRLFPDRTWIQRFADGYFGRLVLVAVAVFGATLAAIAAFLHYFLPISLQQYLEIQTYFPAAVILGLGVWWLVARRSSREIRRYLDAGEGVEQRTEGTGAPAGDRPTALSVYRLAQSQPYRLALVSLAIWAVIIAIGAWVARVWLRFEQDDAVLMVGVGVVMAVGAAIYESLWHRETMRLLLAHLATRHRLPGRGVQPSLSLRSKLLFSFGGVVLFACGLALFWGFTQYKNLVTDFVSRQAGLSLAWLRSEVNTAAAARAGQPPTPDLVREALRSVDQRSLEASAVFYYLPNQSGAELVSLGGGSLGAPRLPWYVGAQLRLSHDANIEINSTALSGRRGRVRVRWNGRLFDLGAVAVLYPDYRGRGESVVRPLKELLFFFLALFGACAGIVLLTVGQFVKPIRELERRADGMARGELAEPVSSGGEGDEIGRLTFALEEMRRALREKLRSTEEVNLELDRAVQRRTADLAKKNRELAEALDKLTRAQDQLVRSEKMASIGQLVAGIAHEINNPVNAIVNTVGPLEEAIALIDSEDAAEREEAEEDVRDMIRVIQRGAQRTKAIVQALHNYSRTDDERLVEFELNRGLDDSLELLRHLLKQNITVERDYGDVGRIHGHAGQLNQVFMNLLTNAAQASSGREGSVICIQTREQDGSVVIRISDNGEGIRSEVLPRIFDPFFTTKDVGEGTGLGLSIVHGLVERHGGTIEVESELGEGTTFTVTLPRSPERARSPEPRL